VNIQSGSEDKHSTLTVGKIIDFEKKRIDLSMINLDENGIHANCEQFQINNPTGSKLVAIDSSQIQVYTDDLSINSGIYLLIK
jgi:hypothetical protein